MQSLRQLHPPFAQGTPHCCLSPREAKMQNTHCSKILHCVQNDNSNVLKNAKSTPQGATHTRTPKITRIFEDPYRRPAQMCKMPHCLLQRRRWLRSRRMRRAFTGKLNIHAPAVTNPYVNSVDTSLPQREAEKLPHPTSSGAPSVTHENPHSY